MMQYNKSSGFNSKEPVTADQLNYLKILNYDGNPPKTRGEASLLISERLYHWRPKSPTEPQLAYLGTLGYDGSTPKTRGEASDLISKLLAEKPKSETIRLGGSRLRLDKIPLVIYSDHWSEENPFAHIHEHSKDFYAAKEWRDSLDN
mgnify:FL=1